MNFKNIFLLIIFIVGIILSGCSNKSDVDSDTNSNILNNFFNKNENSGASSKNYPYLEIEIPNLKNKNEININEPFNIILKLYNPSSFDMKNVKGKISGYDTGFITGITPDITFNDIRGKIRDRIDYKTVSIGPASANNFKIEYKPNFNFKICYEQEVKFTSEDYTIPSEDSYDPFDKAKFKDLKLPLQITMSDAYNDGDNNIIFIFDLKNVGQGKVINECFNTEQLISVPVIINSFKVGSIQGTCKDAYTDESNKVIIRNGEGSIKCSVSRNNPNEYNTQIILGLSYKYQFEKSKQINFKDPKS